MSSFALSTTLQQPFESALRAVREALEAEGFGVLTEIDLAGSLKDKFDVDVPPQVILGASPAGVRGPASRSIDRDGTAVQRGCGQTARLQPFVEAFDPDVMMRLSEGEALNGVATDARQRICSMLEELHTA